MKKIKRIIAVALTMALAAMMLVFNVSAADSAKLSDTDITIEVGSTYQLYVDRATSSLSWSSSDKSVATVSNGKITAKKKGSAIITAKHGKTSLKCKVNVVKKGTAKKETTIKMTNSYVTTDRKGNNVLVLEFDFTNYEEDAESFSFFAITKVFQNGIECDVSYYADIDTSNNLKDIKPGATIHVAKAFELTDDSPVEIEVTELIGRRVFLTKTLKIK